MVAINFAAERARPRAQHRGCADKPPKRWARHGGRSLLRPRTGALRRFPCRGFGRSASIALLVLGLLAQTVLAQDPKRFAKEIDAFTNADKTNPPPKNAILFIGSSTIRKWTTLAEDFPGKKVFNRGFGGSQMSDAVYYFDRIVAPYQPGLIVLYEGSNDINDHKTPQQVFDNFKAFVAKVHEQLPQTRLDYISILTTPVRAAQVEQVKEANRLIRDYIAHDEKLTFIDAFPALLGPDGQADPALFLSDRLHPNAKGYAKMQPVIAPYLDKP